MGDANLMLWDAVEKTNPKHTKEVNFGRKFTAIDPYRQIQKATKQFGPAGEKWGWSVHKIEYPPTNSVAVLIRLWHGSRENYIEQWGQASFFIDNKETKKDHDFMKKATTDGVTKCLSYLGFNADVFFGKYDDNKYVQEMHEEFAEENGKQPDNSNQPARPQKQATTDNAIKAQAFTDAVKAEMLTLHTETEVRLYLTGDTATGSEASTKMKKSLPWIAKNFPGFHEEIQTAANDRVAEISSQYGGQA